MILQKDSSFKKFLIGTIVGHFSDEEINFYLNNTRELNRRIIQIITQRLEDSLAEIY